MSLRLRWSISRARSAEGGGRCGKICLPNLFILLALPTLQLRTWLNRGHTVSQHNDIETCPRGADCDNQ